MSQGMRNLLAIVLSLGVLIAWSIFFAPKSKPPLPAEPKPQAVPQPEAAAPPPTLSSSFDFAKGETVVLENELVLLKLNTSGGVVTDWKLKQYAHNGGDPSLREPVSLAEANGGILHAVLEGGDLPDPTPFTVAERSRSSVVFRWQDKTRTLFKRISLPPESYQLEVELELANRSPNTLSFTPTAAWGKRPVEESPQRGVLFFKSPPDRWHPVFYRTGKLEKVPWEKIEGTPKEGPIGWLGAQSRYFLGVLVPVTQAGQRLELERQTTGDPYFRQRIFMPPVQLLPQERWLQKFRVYGGPKDLKRLKTVGPGVEEAIGYGWITLIAVPLLYLLKFFYQIVHNYGVAIILLTVLVKILLNPINRKSLESMKKMQTIQPRLKELRERYGNNKEKINQEMMQLFKAHKINPMGGCLPMLLQIPIYIALYQVLWNSVELYQAPFVWFYKDLSAPDPYLITPVLLGITMFFQTKMTPTATVDPMQQKMMMLMPLMFCVFMVFLPMGLGLYILVNTLMTILQQWMYRKEIRMRDVVLGRVFGR